MDTISESMPSVPGNYFQEQAGVLALFSIAQSLRCIWRPTPNADLGIDGQLELINQDGRSTGQVVAVQIKSGKSYVKRGDDLDIVYHPEQKHRLYWSSFPIPVMLAIHDPDANLIYWTDARRYLRSVFNRDSKAIKIPRLQVLNEAARAALLETCGAFDTPLLPVKEVAVRLASTRTKNSTFNISFLELFALGSIDIGRKLFFNIDLCLQIAELKPQPAIEQGEDALLVAVPTPSFEDYEFINQYIRFLVSQGLVYYDFYDFLVDWEERQVTPIFASPLTRRGREVQEYLNSLTNVTWFSEHSVQIQFNHTLPLLLMEVEGVRKKLIKQVPLSNSAGE